MLSFVWSCVVVCKCWVACANAKTNTGTSTDTWVDFNLQNVYHKSWIVNLSNEWSVQTQYSLPLKVLTIQEPKSKCWMSQINASPLCVVLVHCTDATIWEQMQVGVSYSTEYTSALCKCSILFQWKCFKSEWVVPMEVQGLQHLSGLPSAAQQTPCGASGIISNCCNR